MTHFVTQVMPINNMKRGLEEHLFWLAFYLHFNLMFLFWVAFSFVCDHARFRTPFKKSGFKPGTYMLVIFTKVAKAT